MQQWIVLFTLLALMKACKCFNRLLAFNITCMNWTTYCRDYGSFLPYRTMGSLIISSIGGVLCGAVFLIDSMITDLIDADEVETGQRKESLYFAVWKSGLKVARALAFVVIGLGLQAMGLDMSHDVVSDSTQWGIVLLFGIAVGLCFVVAAYFIWRADVPEPNET